MPYLRSGIRDKEQRFDLASAAIVQDLTVAITGVAYLKRSTMPTDGHAAHRRHSMPPEEGHVRLIGELDARAVLMRKKPTPPRNQKQNHARLVTLD